MYKNQKKYLSKRKQLRVWTTPEKLERFKLKAKDNGTSMYQLINDFMDDYLKGDCKMDKKYLHDDISDYTSDDDIKYCYAYEEPGEGVMWTYEETVDGRYMFTDTNDICELEHKIKHPEKIKYDERDGYTYYGRPLPWKD